MNETTAYPHPHRYGRPHRDTREPEGFTFILDENPHQVLRLLETATGHAWAAKFENGDRPHEITQLVRHRMPTAEECASHRMHVTENQPIIDHSEVIKMVSPESPGDRPTREGEGS